MYILNSNWENRILTIPGVSVETSGTFSVTVVGASSTCVSSSLAVVSGIAVSTLVSSLVVPSPLVNGCLTIVV